MAMQRDGEHEAAGDAELGLTNAVEPRAVPVPLESAEAVGLLGMLLGARPVGDTLSGEVAVIGELIALIDGGRTPLVRIDDGLDAPAVRARTTIDLHGDHVGHSVLLVTAVANGRRQPIIVGVLRADPVPLPATLAESVEVTSEGERLVVSAKRELVLRCGKSSVTLREDGKVEIRGESIVTRATGANRVQGGSVQLN